MLQVAAAGADSVSAPFGPKLKTGDTVMVEVDPLVKTVVFYRNQVSVLRKRCLQADGIRGYLTVSRQGLRSFCM